MEETVFCWEDAKQDCHDPWQAAIDRCCNNHRVRPYLREYPTCRNHTKPTTRITSTGALAQTTKLALITQDIECGLPHTRPGKICLPTPQPSLELLVHELVHIWQRNDQGSWDNWLSQAWNCAPITTPDAHTRDDFRERFNPDTFYAGWYAYRQEEKGREKYILPLPILKSTAVKITHTDIKFFNVQRNAQGNHTLTEITPKTPFAADIPVELKGHQLEHPFETAAYIIAQWYNVGTPKTTDQLINTITPENIKKQIGEIVVH